MLKTHLVWATLLGTSLSVPAFAIGYSSAGAGNYSIGLQLGTISSEQPQINQLIQNANKREGGISTSPLSSAYEGGVQLTYRFTGTIYALQFRPSYFYEVQKGSGSGGAFKYGMQGYTVFPIFRLYPLENDIMKFYLQIGLGYGHVFGQIEENNKGSPGHGAVSFSNGAFGTLVGLGAEFCLTTSHCVSLEGNYRYLWMDRMLTTSSSGSFDTTNGSLSQWQKGLETEMYGSDLAANMGGLMFIAGYNYWF